MLEKLKNNMKNYFSTGPKAAFVIVLLMMCMVISILNMKKTIVVLVDGKSRQITTLRSSLVKILADNNIAVGPKDKITPNLNVKVENGDKISIKKAVDVVVKVDGRQLKIKSAEDNVGDMLKAEKIQVGDDDKISPLKDAELAKNLNVTIVRVDSVLVNQYADIDFQVVTKQDDNMEKGVQKVVTEGKKGQKEFSFKVIYEDGKEVSRKLISELITQNPIDRIISVGTLGVINDPSRGGKIYYTSSVGVRATAYSSDFNSTGKNPGDYGFGITATGTRARRSVGGYSSVAVDPNVIPLGTKLYIPGYGCAIAEDTGRGIKGNAIDVYFDSESQALSWGMKWLTVYILK